MDLKDHMLYLRSLGDQKRFTDFWDFMAFDQFMEKTKQKK